MDKIERGNPLTQSDDIVKNNLEILKQLFPTIVKEGKIDVDELKALIDDDVETSEEYYRFTWAGKSEARREANKPSTGTLRPNKADSKDWDTTGNIFIEGDNLEVLKLLQKSYAGKIKMMYFDPPYNTGKDFVYKDKYADNLGNYLDISNQVDSAGNKYSTNTESDGRYHSNWLNMMYPRLKLARNLMSDDGVIFASIDDNEVHNFRKLFDDIFGEANFLGLFINISTPNARDYGHIGKMHEFCLFYAKDIYKTTTNLLEDKDKSFKYVDEISGFNIHPLYNSNVAFTNENRPNLYYPFYINLDNRLSDLGDDFYEIGLTPFLNTVEIYPPKSVKDNVQFVWRWGKDKAKDDLNNEIIGYETEEGEYRIVQKMRTSEKVIRSLLYSKEFTTRRGTAEVEHIFKKKIFSFPKPVEYILNFIKVGTNKNSIVMDFFSGSGTTAHAVMKQNATDGGNRKYICIQLPELTEKKSEAYKAGYSNLANICKDRLKKSGDMIVEELNTLIKDDEIKKNNLSSQLNFTDDNEILISPIELLSNLDTGFKAFKLDSSNIHSWDGSVENFEANLFNAQNNIKDDRSEEDVLYEILLKYGLDLTVPIQVKSVSKCKVYSIGAGVLFICLSDNITTEVAKAIGEWKKELEPATCRVLFKDNGFIDDVAKTNSVQILRQYGIEECNSI